MGDKLEPQAAPLAAIDAATLTPLVRRALNSETVELTGWSFEELKSGIGSGTAVYRFTGQGRDQGQAVPWSLILKTLQPESPVVDASAWNYYRREVDAYQSGDLEDLPGGLAAPRTFDIVEYPDGAYWLWLENVRDDVGQQWPLDHYGVVARHVGQFNGAYLVDRRPPDKAWLCSSWIRRYVEDSAPAMEPLRASLGHPLVRRWFPGDSSEWFFRLWAERQIYLDALDRLPQTVCHFDLFRRNLIARQTAGGDHQTVAIDWAYAGHGPIGADINPLVVATVSFFEVDLERSEELEGIVFEGYLDGLRDAGWRGDPRLARLGYAASGLRYTFAEIGRWLVILQDESLWARVEQCGGRPLGEIFDAIALMRRHFGRLMDEARALIDVLGWKMT